MLMTALWRGISMKPLMASLSKFSLFLQRRFARTDTSVAQNLVAAFSGGGLALGTNSAYGGAVARDCSGTAVACWKRTCSARCLRAAQAMPIQGGLRMLVVSETSVWELKHIVKSITVMFSV
jgi:hypothetical protein